jgi:tetratricopeptide (TPR) repeat protein
MNAKYFTHKHIVLLVLSLACCSCQESERITTTSPEALKYYYEGVRSLDRFYYADALASFQKALQLDTSFALASARLALVYSRTGNEQAARQEIANAVVKSFSSSKQEQLFIRLLDHALYFRNQEAAAAADSLIALSPKNAEAYMFRGNFFEMNKDFDAGLEMYRKGIEADTSYAMTVMSLGYAYSARGELENAIEQMERYIRLVPDAADPRASFADILFRAGRYDEALAQYNESLKLKPDYWYAINRIGDVYTMLGRLNEAERQFDIGMTKMVMNNQTRATHLAIEAVLQFQRGNYKETIRLCEQSLALDSTNGKAVNVRVLALAKLKKFDDAEETIQILRAELLRRNLGESSAMLGFHLLSAMYLRETGLFDKALTSCDSAFEFGSELSRAEVYHEQAEIHLKQSDYDGALDALEGALRYNANSPEALLTLTKVYRATGDKQMTNEIGNRLLDLWKNADSDFQPLIELKQLLGKSSQHRVAVS